MSTSRGLLRSGSAATAAQLVRIVALQLTHIVVRRHVPPEELGVWNWIEPLFLLLATLRDLGVPSHVVRLVPMPFGSLLRVELRWGLLLAAGVALGAPWLALGFAAPGPALVAALRVMAVFLVLEGLSAVALTWFESRLEIERTLSAELARTATYCAVVLAASLHGYGFWSFVLAQIAAQAVFAAELWRRARREITLVEAPGPVLGLVRASLPVGTVWLLSMAVMYADSFVVGGLFDRRALGLYAFGYGYAFLVTRILQQPFGRALYPAFVAHRAEPEEQFRAYRLATVVFLGLEMPAALFLAANSELVTLLLAGREYLDAAPYLALLAFAPIVDPLGRFGGELLLARNRDRARLISLGLQLGALVGGGVVLSLVLDSPFGMALANFLPVGSLVVLVVLARGGDRAGLARLTRDLLWVYFVPVVPFALVWTLWSDRPWLHLVVTLLAAAASVGWVWRRYGTELRAYFSEPVPGAP